MCRRLIYLVSIVLVLSTAGSASAELVAYWKFDEGSGTTAFDSSGNGLNGTLLGDTQWAAGKMGGALEFDGDGDYVDCGNNELFDITDELTVSAWINIRSVTAAWMAVITKGDSAWRISINNTTQGMHFGIEDGTRGWQAANSTIELPLNEWYHVCGTYDLQNGGRIYIDGVLDGTNPDLLGITHSTYNVYIGENAQAVNRWWDGFIDDVQLYNHALTEAEILAVMEGAEAYPYAFAPGPADGFLHEDIWVNLSWRAGDFAVSHDVYLGDNFDDVNDGAPETFQGNQAAMFIVAGFPGFPYPDGLIPGTTYYWRIDEVNDTEPNSPWKGPVWSFSIPPNTAYYPDPAYAAEQVDPGVTLSWTPGFGAKLHTVYLGENFDEVDNAAGGLPQGITTYSPGTLKMAQTYYWRVDEFDGFDTYKGDVWSFTTEGAVGNPNPANGAVDVKQTQIITFSPSVYAASHELYFGTDKDAVKNANTGSPEYKGTRALGAETYDPGKLEWDTTYYWRIDEVDNANPDSPWTGILWSFTTANFLIVDDFESYNDLDPADPDSNRIFNAWLDGYDDPTNGSLVGYETPPFAEQTIVHGGNQSLPIYYDNSVGYSEATLTLTYPRDWTEKGVDTLTIWFRGNSTNAAETLYVALNGSAIVTNDNPDAAQITAWTEWTIDLQAFGVNLANVNTIVLGLGNKTNPQAGGSGTMYFDDIRLYPPAP